MGGFITAGIKVMAGTLLDSKRVLHWNLVEGFPDARLRAKSLVYADYRTPARIGEEGGHCSTPRSVMTGVRETFVPALLGDAGETRARTLVFITRKSGMRSTITGSTDLRRKLKEIAKDASPPLVFETFDGGLSPERTAALFGRARLVVDNRGIGADDVRLADVKQASEMVAASLTSTVH